MEARVTSVRRATASTRIVRLAPEDAFTYRAGQAASLAPPLAESLLPFSIASAPEDTERDGYLEFLIKVDEDERWGDAFDPLRRGQTLRLKGPFGRFTFPDHPAERHFLFIAGGTGIAPLRSMIRHARAVVDGRFKLLYSARTPLDFAYRRELCGMARRREIAVTLNATRDVAPGWRGRRGRIVEAQLAALIEEPATLCFVCGPAAMVEDVPRTLTKLGIDRSRIRIEERGPD
jgi:ferredoxin-NADP reductase